MHGPCVVHHDVFFIVELLTVIITRIVYELVSNNHQENISYIYSKLSTIAKISVSIKTSFLIWSSHATKPNLIQTLRLINVPWVKRRLM